MVKSILKMLGQSAAMVVAARIVNTVWDEAKTRFDEGKTKTGPKKVVG
jgi:hypothetical protein